ncbi:MAG: asparagine synthase B [Bacteroidaceae bacterium]|nr:asparagine synthase B [Bacteroidaceae bacterium]
MCGIVGIFNIKNQSPELRTKALKMSQKIRHRGPDWSGIYSGKTAILAHERLSIVDPLSGGQPLISPDGKHILCVNGEIYNHKEIRRRSDFEFKTGSDCESILAIYQDIASELAAHPEKSDELITGLFEQLSGIFAFGLYDEEQDTFLIGRDPIGVIPLYIGHDSDGKVYIGSELKALEGFCEEYEPFLPGHYYYSKTGLNKWYKRDWEEYANVKDNGASSTDIKIALEDAVKRQLMSDVPYGVLLSGGLDSSVTSAVAMKFAHRRIEENMEKGAWWPQLHSFAVGLKGAPDLAKAREVADFIGTVHHEINYTVQEGLDAIRDVIYYIETYDVTTVRASTPMYLLARVIKSMGIKMVLSGEGADEVFGGYLYFHKAPSAEEFHKETVRKIGKLYLYDCLRANKSLSAWGVEGRVPFLDKEFLDVAMRLNPEAKMCPGTVMEKKIVREAFQDMLPASVAWRQKEQFSDGVGYSWIDTLKKLTSEAVSDEQMAHAAERFPINTPLNKEEYYYRTIFEEHFPSESAAKSVPHEASVACSTAIALEWDAAWKNMNDPSGRAVKGVHEQAY